MANQQIDSLSLEISIKGLNEKDVKNLQSLANSIDKLQKSLKTLELNKLQKLEIPQKLKGLTGAIYPDLQKPRKNKKLKFVEYFAEISRMQKGFDYLTKSSENFGKNFKLGTTQSTKDLFLEKGIDDLIDKTKLFDSMEITPSVDTSNLLKINTDVKELKVNTDGATHSFENLEEAAKFKVPFGKYFEEINMSKTSAEGFWVAMQKDTNAVNGFVKSVGKVPKEAKKLKTPRKQLSAIEKQLNRIKTIGLIKLIRGAMQGIIKGMGESYKNLALFDSKFNETLSTLKTAKTQAFNSIALITAPLISVVAPIVQGISSNLVDMANNVSKITASLKGATTYTKVNADYMEDYAKSMEKAQNFSFDTFNTLDYQDNNMFETAEITEAVDETNDLYSIFADVKDIVVDTKTIFGDIAKLVGGFLSDNMGNIREIVAQSKEFTNTIKNVLTKINFEKVLKNITTNLSKVIGFVGIILDLVEGILEVATPLIDTITSDLSPALLDMFVSTISPIFEIIKAISPIITTLVELIVSVLTPILKVISPIISTIGNIVSRIGEMVAWLVENFLTTKIVEALKGITTLLQPVIEIISWVLKAVGEIFNMIDALLHGDWEGLANSFGKFIASIGVAILKFFAGIIDFIINGVIEAINFVLTPLRETIKAFGGSWDGITWRSNLVGSVPSYANGGIVGELWQMNEYGNPEMLYNANGNSTAVITQDQLARAFENAIFNTGLLDAITDSKNIYIDGKNIAQSKNFKSELNRTNPNLNIK